MRDFSDEQRLLVCIARRSLRSAEQVELREISQRQINWENVCDVANTHGLVPLLNKHLAQHAGDLVPAHIQLRLKQQSLANAQTALNLVGKLSQVCQLFKQNEIPVAVFKGAVLAEMAYGDLALRQAGDIDLLIPIKDFARAKTLLTSRGYQMFPELNSSQQNSHLANHCEIQFQRDEQSVVLDLHWSLAPRTVACRVAAADVLDRLQSVEVSGVSVPTFSDEDLVIYLAMHGAKHLWPELECIASLAEIIRSRQSINWETLIERAETSRTKRMVALALHLIDLFYEQPPPLNVVTVLDQDGKMKNFASEIRDNIFMARSVKPDSTESNLYNFKISDYKIDAVSSLLRATFLPTLSDWQAYSLPSSLHPLYFGLRPLRLSKTYSTLLWRKLRHKPMA